MSWVKQSAKRWVYCFVTVLLFFIQGASALAIQADSSPCHYLANAKTIGVVRDAESQQLLYCEHHFSSDNTVIDKVEYRNVEQVLMAEKTLDYSTGKLSPSVMQNDFRHGEMRSAMAERATLNGSISVNMQYRPANSHRVKNSRIDVSKAIAVSSDESLENNAPDTSLSLVIDAGFDYAVRDHWSTLYNGDVEKFSFASPVHGQTFALSIRRSNKKTCSQKTYDKSTQVCYLVKPSNIMLSWFVKPIELIYDIASRRLVTFSGEVNITDAEGKTQRAVIEYYYLNLF